MASADYYRVNLLDVEGLAVGGGACRVRSTTYFFFFFLVCRLDFPKENKTVQALVEFYMFLI